MMQDRGEGGGCLLVQHHTCRVTHIGGFRTLCSLLPASSSCRSLAFSSSLVLCLICSWRSADSCSLSSFMAEIFDFSSRTTRSVSYRKEKKPRQRIRQWDLIQRLITATCLLISNNSAPIHLSKLGYSSKMPCRLQPYLKKVSMFVSLTRYCTKTPSGTIYRIVILYNSCCIVILKNATPRSLCWVNALFCVSVYYEVKNVISAF